MSSSCDGCSDDTQDSDGSRADLLTCQSVTMARLGMVVEAVVTMVAVATARVDQGL